MQWPKILRRFGSSLKVWLPLTIFLLGTCFVLLRLASGRISGVPDSSRKSVTVYYFPRAEKSPLAFFLQPPMSTLEIKGPGQPLALQFTNNSSVPISLEPVEVQPAPCFQLRETSTHVATLAARQTHVAFYQLTAPEIADSTSRAECDGQHSLTIRFAFTTRIGASKHRKGKLIHNESSISTSPILITSHRKLTSERFFHIAGALAIPLLLAIATFLIQQFQDRRAQLQKEQELKLEVWKIIFPIIDGHIRKHYVPISRQMDLVRVETSKAPGSVDTANLLASLLVLRATFNLLGSRVGGFYFRTKTAEEVGAMLANEFWDDCYRISTDKDKLFQSTEALSLIDTIPQAKAKLLALGVSDPSAARFHTQFQSALGQAVNLTRLDRYLDLMIQVLDFENNLLWYPEWYTTPPHINIKAFSPDGLDLPTSSQQELKKLIKNYRKELPIECRLG